MPVSKAAMQTSRMPRRMAMGEIQPCAQARSGPRRSSPSVPRRKSYRSLMKLDATCIRLAKRAQSTAMRHEKLPWRKAKAVAQNTDTNAPESVFGRAARYQAWQEFWRIIFRRERWEGRGVAKDGKNMAVPPILYLFLLTITSGRWLHRRPASGLRSCGWGRRGKCLPNLLRGRPERRRQSLRERDRCSQGRCRRACSPNRGR